MLLADYEIKALALDNNGPRGNPGAVACLPAKSHPLRCPDPTTKQHTTGDTRQSPFQQRPHLSDLLQRLSLRQQRAGRQRLVR